MQQGTEEKIRKVSCALMSLGVLILASPVIIFVIVVCVMMLYQLIFGPSE